MTTNIKRWVMGDAEHKSLYGHVLDGLNALGSLLIFIIMALICADVFSRNAFNAPINGVAEMVSASIVMIVFLQLASALRHGRLAQADIFIGGFSRRHPRAGNVLNALFHLAGAWVMWLVYKGTWPVFVRAWERNQFMGIEGVFTLPVWPIRIVVLTCALVTVSQFLLLAGQYLYWAWTGQAAHPHHSPELEDAA
ncbi:TRAP transporter small permease subunit [Salinispirillum marinum]|uniref:TRAP transporter small permease protein n=2 Tax=Saccharospirillaceae TaxID=255527 RepID=A0ABV8BE99_9GAMM